MHINMIMTKDFHKDHTSKIVVYKSIGDKKVITASFAFRKASMAQDFYNKVFLNEELYTELILDGKYSTNNKVKRPGDSIP